MLHTIKNNYLTVTVDTFGAQMMSVKSADGYEYMWQGEKWWEDRCPVLFPTCGNCPTRKYYYGGKEYKLPIHGIAMYKEFTLKSASDDTLLFVLKSDEGTLEQYPFDFEFAVEFKLTDSELTVKLMPKNTGDKVMPYMTGWHPGFNLWGDEGIGDFSVDFGKGEELDWYPIPPDAPISKYSRKHALNGGKYFLNEEEIYANDTMIFENYPKSFSLKDGNGYAKISMEVSDNLSFFCIWKEPCSEARFVCLEPWSNIFNSDGTTEHFEKKEMQRLEPGCCGLYTYKVKFN